MRKEIKTALTGQDFELENEILGSYDTLLSKSALKKVKKEEETKENEYGEEYEDEEEEEDEEDDD